MYLNILCHFEALQENFQKLDLENFVNFFFIENFLCTNQKIGWEVSPK